MVTNIQVCIAIQAIDIDLEVPRCILQSLFDFLNLYAEQLPTLPESFISEEDSMQFEAKYIYKIEGIYKKLPTDNPSVFCLIEQIRESALAEAIPIGSP